MDKPGSIPVKATKPRPAENQQTSDQSNEIKSREEILVQS